MKVEDAVRQFLISLIEYLKNKSWITDVDIELDIDSLESIIQGIKDAVSSSHSQISEKLSFVSEIISGDRDEVFENEVDEISRINAFRIITDSDDNFKEKIRYFVFANTKGAVICRHFFEKIETFREIISSALDVIYDNVFELIVYLGKSQNQEEINSFFNFLFDDIFPENSLILIKKSDALDDEELYSFLYFKYLAKGYRTLLDENMIYAYGLDPNIDQEIESLSNFKFTQFFEILDVFDEYQHTTDILLRFLKLYQIIEYLLIRVLLVKIQARTGQNKQFLRELMGMKKHNDFDKKLFRELFDVEKSDLKNWLINLVQNQNIRIEIEKYSGKLVDASQNSEEYWLNLLADLLYQLRNSIVHNKESECHITIHTASSVTINLTREILLKLEKIILKKLMGNDMRILYTNRNLRLY